MKVKVYLVEYVQNGELVIWPESMQKRIAVEFRRQLKERGYNPRIIKINLSRKLLKRRGALR